jgi:hypothetical protein
MNLSARGQDPPASLCHQCIVVEMTVVRTIEIRTARPAEWTLTLLLAVMPMAGCLGGPSQEPQLEIQQRELSKRPTNPRPGRRDPRPADEMGAELDGEDAGMDDETPAPLDPQPAEPAPESDDSVRCGNGVLDDEELCEIGIPEGEPGSCPSDCPGDECNPERLEVNGCRTVCLPDAPPPEADCP